MFFFHPCHDKKETGTSNWNDRRRNPQGKTVRMDVDRITQWLNVGGVTDALEATRLVPSKVI